MHPDMMSNLPVQGVQIQNGEFAAVLCADMLLNKWDEKQTAGENEDLG